MYGTVKPASVERKLHTVDASRRRHSILEYIQQISNKFELDSISNLLKKLQKKWIFNYVKNAKKLFALSKKKLQAFIIVTFFLSCKRFFKSLLVGRDGEGNFCLHFLFLHKQKLKASKVLPYTISRQANYLKQSKCDLIQS